MLTHEDIKNLTQAFSLSFPTKVDMQTMHDDLKKDFSNLTSGVDGYAKKADDYFQEMVMLSHKVDRHEKWLLEIAKKLDIKLEY